MEDEQISTQKVINMIKKHTNCRGPHKTNYGFTSCLIMVLAQLMDMEPWDVVKKMGVEKRYKDIPTYKGRR